MPATRSRRSQIHPTETQVPPSSQIILSDPSNRPQLFHGVLLDLQDLLILIQAVIRGSVARLSGSPSALEKERLVKSGTVVVFEEEETGIKRWSDPVIWSQTRGHGIYLLYRQATEGDPWEIRRSRGGPIPSSKYADTVPEELKPLQGALADGKKCRGPGHVLADGMVKKTRRVVYAGPCGSKIFHIVNYYYVEDVQSGLLKRPSEDPKIRHLINEIDEPLLNPDLWKGCTLLTRRNSEGRLVYAGEYLGNEAPEETNDEPSPKPICPPTDSTTTSSAGSRLPSADPTCSVEEDVSHPKGQLHSPHPQHPFSVRRSRFCPYARPSSAPRSVQRVQDIKPSLTPATQDDGTFVLPAPNAYAYSSTPAPPPYDSSPTTQYPQYAASPSFSPRSSIDDAASYDWSQMPHTPLYEQFQVPQDYTQFTLIDNGLYGFPLCSGTEADPDPETFGFQAMGQNFTATYEPTIIWGAPSVSPDVSDLDSLWAPPHSPEFGQ